MFLTTNRLLTILFVILLVGAAFFSLERILFADASFILFRIVNQQVLQIQEHRYGSFITQGLPLLAVWLKLPLPVIIFLYSLSFNLFYLATVLLLLNQFRQIHLAILMGFYHLLFVSDTWFWVNNEVHQGIAWMFLFFGATIAMGKKTHGLFTFPVFTLLAFLTLYTHPLLLFPTSFLWLFIITGKDWPFSRPQTVLFSLILLALAVSKLLLSSGSSSHYDAEKLHNVTHVSLQDILTAFRSPLAKEILQRTIWNYWIVPVLFTIGLVAAWRKKAHWHVALTISFSLLYFIALCLAFKDFLPFYTESELMPATIILTAPFVYYALPQLEPQRQAVLLALIFLTRLGYIGYASQKWVGRKEWIIGTLDTMRRQHITKGIVYENEENKRILQMTWGTPVESIVASALSNEKPQRTFVVGNPESLHNQIPPDSSYMISSFELLKNDSFNKRYFSFDTTTNYQVLKVK